MPPSPARTSPKMRRNRSSGPGRPAPLRSSVTLFTPARAAACRREAIGRRERRLLDESPSRRAGGACHTSVEREAPLADCGDAERSARAPYRARRDAGARVRSAWRLRARRRTPPRPKRVLVLFDEDKELPGLALILRSLREVFEAEMPGGIEIHTESMNLSQFRGEGYDRLLAAHYRQKYADRKPDLLVAVMGPSLDFLLRHGESIFPGTPIVFCGADASDLEGKTLPANVTGVLLKRVLRPDARGRAPAPAGHARRLPGLRGLGVRPQAGGPRAPGPPSLRGPPDHHVPGGASHGRPARRLASLPPHSVVLYTTVFTDGAGRPFVPHEALSRIAEAANAPVYVFVDQYVGRGAVGGHVYTVDQHGVSARRRWRCASCAARPRRPSPSSTRPPPGTSSTGGSSRGGSSTSRGCPTAARSASVPPRPGRSTGAGSWAAPPWCSCRPPSSSACCSAAPGACARCGPRRRAKKAGASRRRPRPASARSSPTRCASPPWAS